MQSSSKGRESWLLSYYCLTDELFNTSYKYSVVLTHGAVGWSAVSDFGISWSYSLTFCMCTGHRRTLTRVSNDIWTGLTDKGNTWIAKFYKLIVLLKKIIHENRHWKNVRVVLNF